MYNINKVATFLISKLLLIFMDSGMKCWLSLGTQTKGENTLFFDSHSGLISHFIGYTLLVLAVLLD